MCSQQFALRECIQSIISLLADCPHRRIDQFYNTSFLKNTFTNNLSHCINTIIYFRRENGQSKASLRIHIYKLILCSYICQCAIYDVRASHPIRNFMAMQPYKIFALHSLYRFLFSMPVPLAAIWLIKIRSYSRFLYNRQAGQLSKLADVTYSLELFLLNRSMKLLFARFSFYNQLQTISSQACYTPHACFPSIDRAHDSIQITSHYSQSKQWDCIHPVILRDDNIVYRHTTLNNCILLFLIVNRYLLYEQ